MTYINDINDMDCYVDSILKNVDMNQIIDMNEMDRYVDSILKNLNKNIIEEYEIIELRRPIVQNKKSKNCSIQ